MVIANLLLTYFVVPSFSKEKPDILLKNWTKVRNEAWRTDALFISITIDVELYIAYSG